MTDTPKELSAERLAEIRTRCKKSDHEPNFDHHYCLPLVDCWALFDHIDALTAAMKAALTES